MDTFVDVKQYELHIQKKDPEAKLTDDHSLESKHHILGNTELRGDENSLLARSKTSPLRPLLHRQRVPSVLDPDN